MHTEREALELIRAMATRSVPNCINLQAIDRILGDTTLPSPATSISGGADEPLAKLVELAQDMRTVKLDDFQTSPSRVLALQGAIAGFCAEWDRTLPQLRALSAAPASVTSPVEPGDAFSRALAKAPANAPEFAKAYLATYLEDNPELDYEGGWSNDAVKRFFVAGWAAAAEMLVDPNPEGDCGPPMSDHAAQHWFGKDAAALTSSLGGAETPGGAALIATERQRQIEKEGYTSAHDDKHEGKAQLAFAAAAYAIPAIDERNAPVETVKFRTHFWPWSIGYFKPTPNDRVRELVKAGALIAAEIDRLQRAASHV